MERFVGFHSYFGLTDLYIFILLIECLLCASFERGVFIERDLFSGGGKEYLLNLV